MRILISFLFLFFFFSLNAQMIDDSGNVKYGNEWINYSQEYYKITLSEDGLYRMTYQDLSNAGVNINSISGDEFQLFFYGKEVPIYVSTKGLFGSNDYIEFYGEKNKSQLDSFLFRNSNDILNPNYSMFTNEAAYFLTWSNSDNQRFQDLENNLSGDLPPVENFYIHEEKIIKTSDYIKPLRNVTNHVYKSNFDTGEGFGSKLQQINSFGLSISNIFNSGFKPMLKVRLATNLLGHNIEIKINNKLLKRIIRNGIIVESIALQFEESDLVNDMQISLEGNSSNDKNTVSSVSVLYSREYRFLNKSYFSFKLNSSNYTRYFEVKDFDLNGDSFVLYDIKNKKRILPKVDEIGGLVKFVLPPSGERDLVLVNIDKSIKSIQSINKVIFENAIENIDKDYIIISKKDVFSYTLQDYADYRSSGSGGSFKTVIIDIEDIYNQFGYGIARHSQSLNNFIIYIKDKFIDPKYVLIIGKGIEYNEVRTEEQLNDPINLFQIPTYGKPGSDNLMAARQGKNYPVIPIGRIASKNASQLNTYLNKVKKHESNLSVNQTIEEKEWMKKIIHLVGGSSDIIDQIRNSLVDMGKIARNSFMGAKINTYERNSGTSQESVTDLIVSDIEKGASMVTFYGHSGVSGTDFNISGINSDRYPVFYSLGCYSGNIHTNSPNGQSESFLLNEGGVIIYAGTSGTGFTSSLAKLGKTIYDNTANSMYGKSIGSIIQKSLKTIGESNFDIGTVTLNQQFTFHGDPAIKLHSFDQPDYIVDNETINSIPSEITSTDVNFSINFNVVNIGKGIDDSLKIKIVRTLPNQEVQIIYKKVKAPKYKTPVSISIPTNGIKGVGENCVSIYINPENDIVEGPKPQADDNNNYISDTGENSFCLNILSNKIKPIYPEEFGIVNKTNIKLQASLSNYFSNFEDYIFQIDTSEVFDSPLIKEDIIHTDKSFLSWSPNINFQDNTVYYWRVGLNNSDRSIIKWKNSSFIYLSNSKEGWNQSHYYQYLKDEFDGTTFDGRKFDFESKIMTVRIIGKKYDGGKVCYVDGETWGHMNEMYNLPIINISGWGPDYWFRNKTKTDFSSLQTKSYNSISFKYKPVNPDQVTGIKELIEAMPDSMTIFFYTILGDETSNLYPEEWANDSIDLGYNLFSIMEGYGAKKLRLMENRGTVPYILIFKKGKGVIFEKIGETIDDVFEVSQNVSINNKKGFFISKEIGPAMEWNNVLWQESNKDENDIDSYVVVYKLDANKNKTIVDTMRSTYNLDISSINAQEFPYLQLKFYAEDKIKRDPPKIDYWRVLYKEYPDAILLKNSSSYFLSDTLGYGDQLKFKSSIYNNTGTDMESIIVEYKIKQQNKKVLTYTETYPQLLANSSYDIDFEFDKPIGELIGNNEFSVEINADQNQKEKTRSNNSGNRSFYVKSSSLPMKLVVFKANKVQNDIEIQWISKNEVNCDGYIIERSIDGVKFNYLNELQAKGNNLFISNEYNVVDSDPFIGINYYRLKQIDLDGKIKYSKIISMIIDRIENIIISPNPFSNSFFVKTYIHNDNSEVQLLNTEGKVLLSYKLLKGYSSIKIKTEDLLKGVYYCKINTGKTIKTYKILKL